MAAEKVKLTVNITREELEVLRGQAERRGITVTEALRRSIAAGRVFEDAKIKHSKVLLEGPGGKLRQVEVA